MSTLTVVLTHQPAAKPLAENATLTLEGTRALIHIDQSDSLRTIQKSARMLSNLGYKALALDGLWGLDQQWALYCAMDTPGNRPTIEWCKHADADVLQKMADALAFTKAQVNGSPEDISPERLADNAVAYLSAIAGDKITVNKCIGVELQQAGWHGIYQVGRGSTRPPVMLEVDYNPSGQSDAPVIAALVGKGITFDSGGYSIKSNQGMLSMKCDMAGAATVTSALGLAIAQGLSERVKLYLCCAENLISGHAYKLGDIIHYKNGTSVEIHNTDAEGRLVLADGLMAATDSGAPLIIDAATLTGAAMVAVGNQYNALFSLDKSLAEHAISLANEVNEPAWQLPLEPWHKFNCPSHYADTANSSSVKGGGFGGASNAAGFLSRFVNPEGKGWLHFDLASAFNESPTAYLPAGASGKGIRTIAALLLDPSTKQHSL